jgi:importin subunit alpha-1
MDNRRSKRDFKKGICLDSNRRRREENSIKLRKDSKVEGLAKRRNIDQTESFQPQANFEEDESFQKLFRDLLSADSECQTHALRAFRRLLSAEHKPPVAKCIELGVVPIFVKFLENDNNAEQQFEAAWGKKASSFNIIFYSDFSLFIFAALTNIASTDKTSVVVECQAVPKLVKLLMSPNAELREQCAWCLGNIAGDGPHLRDYILSENALQPLLLNITQASSISVLRNCTWALSNFCRGKPQPEVEKLREAIPILSQLIIHEYDLEAMVDATWAFSYLSDGDDRRIQLIIDAGLVPALIKMMASNNANAIIPALRTVGNIVSGNDQQTQLVLDSHGLIPIAQLLMHPKKSIRKEACWVLSNIAAGTPAQLNCIYNVPELIPKVLHQLSTSTEWDVRKEAAWVICNMITSSAQPRLIHLIELGVLQPLCDLLSVGEAKIILLALDALEALLKTTNQVSNENTNCVILIEEIGGVEGLEKLQEHENTKVYERAVEILENYFNVEEEEAENVHPEVGPNGFSFGLANKQMNKHTSFQEVSHSNSSLVEPKTFFNF